MGSEVPILEFSTGPLVGRGSWPVGAGTHLQCPTLRASQGPGGRPVTQLSFSPRSTQGPVDNHVAGKGPRQGAAAPEVHQDHEGNLGPPPQRRPPHPSPPSLTAASPSLQHLRKLNNFNSYLAILSALDSAPIRRLEWQKQTSEVGGCRLVSSHWALWVWEAVPRPSFPRGCYGWAM